MDLRYAERIQQPPQSVTPGPAVPLAVSAAGVTSNTVTIAVQ